MSLFGKPKVFLSDSGTAFKNQVIKELRDLHGVDHHFISAGSHYSHGKQERINLVIGNCFHALLSENHLDDTRWVDLVYVVQSVLNHTPIKPIALYAPIEIFTGLEAINPITSFLDSNDKFTQVVIDSEFIQKEVQAFRELVCEREIFVHEFQEQLVY